MKRTPIWFTLGPGALLFGEILGGFAKRNLGTPFVILAGIADRRGGPVCPGGPPAFCESSSALRRSIVVAQAGH